MTKQVDLDFTEHNRHVEQANEQMHRIVFDELRKSPKMSGLLAEPPCKIYGASFQCETVDFEEVKTD